MHSWILVVNCAKKKKTKKKSKTNRTHVDQYEISITLHVQIVALHMEMIENLVLIYAHRKYLLYLGYFAALQSFFFSLL